MTHRNLVTSVGTTIPHWHKDQVYGELSAAQKAQLQAQTLAAYAGITPVEYIHLNHIAEELLPTHKYNCWGFTFNPRQCWVGNTGTDIQTILNDNGTQVFAPNLRVGDVVCYRDTGNVITHTGRIWSLTAAGNPDLVQSKWGSLGEYLHPLLTVPASYGTNVSYWRVVPIGGKGDAWSKDFPGDDRNVSPPGVALWMSPDLWCNNAGGTGHLNPVRNQANKLWVRVRNEDTLAINNATVHLFWSDPTGGMPHYQWHSIGNALVNVAAGPGTETVAGPVTWTPTAVEPQHCCLFAIVDTGDDPCAAGTLDPIVWPFDVRRDNNIVWKNMWIVAVPAPAPSPKPAMAFPVEFFAENPTGQPAPIQVRAELRVMKEGDLEEMGFDRAAVKRAEMLEPPLKGIEVAPTLERRPGLARRVLGRRTPLEVMVEPQGDLWRRGEVKLLSPRGITLRTRSLPPGKRARVRFWLRPDGEMRRGQMLRLDLEQQIAGHITGGATFIIVMKDRGEVVH